MTRTRMIDVQGRRTRVRTQGDVSAPPMVLLHGIGRSLEDWDLQFERLSTNFRVIAMDLSGSGFSERTASPTTLRGIADGVLATLDVLDELRPVHIVGNSLGGAVAQQITALDPARVAGLVLANSAGFGSEVALPLRLLAVPVLGKAMSRKTTPGAVRIVERLNFADPSLATPLRVEHALAIAARPHTGQVTWETVQGLVDPVRGIKPGWRTELLARVAAAAKPALVVWGDRDRVLPVSHLDEARRALPHASTHVFPGVGHMPQIEAPDAFADLVTTFLSTISTGIDDTSSRRKAGRQSRVMTTLPPRALPAST